jgi:hypothetical protein
VANEHPAALWNWPTRWTIDQNAGDQATPVQAFGAWYTNGAGAPGSNVTQACDFGCNAKCPLFTCPGHHARAGAASSLPGTDTPDGGRLASKTGKRLVAEKPKYFEVDFNS